MELTIEQANKMYNSYMWATVHFEDSTRKHIYTTTNQNISEKRGLPYSCTRTKLYDYRLDEWVDISNGISIDVTKDLSTVGDALSKALYEYI